MQRYMFTNVVIGIARRSAYRFSIDVGIGSQVEDFFLTVLD